MYAVCVYLCKYVYGACTVNVGSTQAGRKAV